MIFNYSVSALSDVVDDVCEEEEALEDESDAEEELCCSFEASASCLSTSDAVPRAVPECCVQYPGVLLCLYQPFALDGQAEVARFPLLVQ